MNRVLLTISIIVLAFAACKNNGSSKSSGFEIFGSDEMKEAAAIIEDANNNDLKKIRILYKENRDRVKELETAMRDKEPEKVRKIAEELITQIDEGMALGETALEKIEKAEGMKINDTYKEYLGVKKDSLRSLLTAFEFRRDAAKTLRDGFGSKNPKDIEKTIATFKEKEGNFQKYKDEGLALSLDANQIYKESIKKQ